MKGDGWTPNALFGSESADCVNARCTFARTGGIEVIATSDAEPAVILSVDQIRRIRDQVSASGGQSAYLDNHRLHEVLAPQMPAQAMASMPGHPGDPIAACGRTLIERSVVLANE